MNIAKYIKQKNESGRKVLSVFLTAGFPQRKGFSDLALRTLDAGADMLEIGIPFSDPIADGPVIQQSSQAALDSGVNVEGIFNDCIRIRKDTDKPLILMCYANPILCYGIENFLHEAARSGVNGLIVPDIPLEEHDLFWPEQTQGLDIILLTTPTTPDNRIAEIDRRSEGFVYCVSVTGTTGGEGQFERATESNLHRTYDQVKKNRLLIGFSISNPDDIRRFSPFCDGFIVGSAVIRRLIEGQTEEAMELVHSLAGSCKKDVF